MHQHRVTVNEEVEPLSVVLKKAGKKALGAKRGAAIALTDLASLVTDSVSAAGIAALPVAAALSVAEPRRHRS